MARPFCRLLQTIGRDWNGVLLALIAINVRGALSAGIGAAGRICYYPAALRV